MSCLMLERIGRAEAGGSDGLGQPAAAVRGRAVDLANGEAVALGVVDDAGGGDEGRGVDHAADDALGGDVARDDPAGVDGFQARALPGAAVALEVPPGNAVLGRKRRRCRGPS